MILHDARTGLRSITKPAKARARIGMIGLSSIVALLALLNLAASVA